nr:reverse transcriptase domain-containing protein [Tanacetum cinerariifolium]
MPRECLKIIKSKSKVHQSQAKVGTNSSTPAISSEVAELKDLVRALLLDKKNQSSASTSSPTFALVKAVEPNCVTCGDTAPVQPSVIQSESQALVSEPVVAPISAPTPNLKPSIPYPSRRDNEKRRDQANEQIKKFYEIFKDMSFEISFTDALTLMPKFASTLKALIRNKEKLNEIARTSMNEHCLAVILNKLPRKLGDLGKFLIPCEFSGMDKCLALADLGASINLMPFSLWEALLLLELTLTCMTLELADRSVSKPIGIAKDVSFKTSRALIDVHKGELTLRIRKEAITYNLDQIVSPTPDDDPIVSTTSPTLTLFGDSDFLLFEEADAFLVSAPMPNMKSSIPYPSRRDNELRPLIGNKEKLSEMARTSMNEHCLAVILNKLPRKLGDPGKFLIPCEFQGMDECLALADLGASINLMPLSVWEVLLLPELTLTCMTHELADGSVSKPIGIAKDVSFKVGVFHFPADFVVVDFEPDPRVPLILKRCFLKIGRALIDVHKGELTLRSRNKAIIYNLDETEVLSFSDVTTSGNPTPHDDPIVSTTSPTLPLFRDSDFLLFEEANAFLGLVDDPDSPKINPFYYDPKADILLLEAILDSEPLPPLLNHEQYLPSFKKELKVCEAKTVKSSVDEPPEVELKDLPLHLEYAFLEGDNKLPVIIAKELGDEEKYALIKILKSHKRAIAWKLSDLQGINLKFCTYKILIEEDYKPVVQHQRRVNPKIHDIIKKEVEKILDAGLIYPISDSPWVSPVHCVPKKVVLLSLRMRKMS